jgi:hypothetical protein
MRIKVKLVLASTLLLLLVLAWAPWMDDDAIHDQVFEERARIDGTTDKQTGKVICDYKVT